MSSKPVAMQSESGSDPSLRGAGRHRQIATCAPWSVPASARDLSIRVLRELAAEMNGPDRGSEPI